MYSSIALASLCVSVSTVNAAALTSTTPLKYIANFDDLPNPAPAVGVAPPKPYKGLLYTGFGLGAPIPDSIALQASTPPNTVVAPYLLDDPLAEPEITSNAAVVPATDCTIRFTGVKAATGKEEIFDFVFEVQGKSAADVALGPEKAQKKAFPAAFSGLTSLKPKVLTVAVPAAGVTVHMGFDDIVYTANVQG